jgi:hypothetical protein
LLLGDHIDTAGLERPDILSTTPLAFRIEAIEIAPDKDEQIALSVPQSM